MLTLQKTGSALIPLLAIVMFASQPVEAQRRGAFSHNDRAGATREISQQPSREINRPQANPRNPRFETNRQEPSGRPFHRSDQNNTSADNTILPGNVSPNRNESFNSPKPNHKGGKRGYTIEKNESAEINNSAQNSNVQPSYSGPKPRPRHVPVELNGGTQSNQGSHSSGLFASHSERPHPGTSNWSHSPRQLTRDDYRRAPLAYRYHYSGIRSYYSAHNPCWRYGYLPRYYSVIHNFYYPYSTIYWGGIGYRYCSGLFYSPFGGGFRVVPPPFGIFIDILPMGYETVYGFNNPYYYYNGVYYEDYNSSYRVIAPPVGAIVESIPDGYETITIDGETYYKVENIQYKPVVQDNGEIWYQVIKVD